MLVVSTAFNRCLPKYLLSLKGYKHLPSLRSEKLTEKNDFIVSEICFIFQETTAFS